MPPSATSFFHRWMSGARRSLHGATLKAVAGPKVKAGFAKLRVEVLSSSAEEFAAFIKEDLDLRAKVVKEAKSMPK